MVVKGVRPAGVSLPVPPTVMQAMRVNVNTMLNDVVFPPEELASNSSFALNASIHIPATLLKERARSKCILLEEYSGTLIILNSIICTHNSNKTVSGPNYPCNARDCTV